MKQIELFFFLCAAAGIRKEDILKIRNKKNVRIIRRYVNEKFNNNLSVCQYFNK